MSLKIKKLEVEEASTITISEESQMERFINSNSEESQRPPSKNGDISGSDSIIRPNVQTEENSKSTFPSSLASSSSSLSSSSSPRLCSFVCSRCHSGIPDTDHRYGVKMFLLDEDEGNTFCEKCFKIFTIDNSDWECEYFEESVPPSHHCVNCKEALIGEKSKNVYHYCLSDDGNVNLCSECYEMFSNKVGDGLSKSDFPSVNILDYSHTVHFLKTSRDYLLCFEFWLFPTEMLYGLNWRDKVIGISVEFSVHVYGGVSKSYDFSPTMTIGDLMTRVLLENDKNPHEYCALRGIDFLPLNPKHVVGKCMNGSSLIIYILPMLEEINDIVYVNGSEDFFRSISLKKGKNKSIKKIGELKQIIKNFIIKKEEGFEELMRNVKGIKDKSQLSSETIRLYRSHPSFFMVECPNGEDIYVDGMGGVCDTVNFSTVKSHPFHRCPLVLRVSITKDSDQTTFNIFLNTRGDSPPLIYNCKHRYDKPHTFFNLKDFLIDRKELEKKDICLFIYREEFITEDRMNEVLYKSTEHISCFVNFPLHSETTTQTTSSPSSSSFSSTSSSSLSSSSERQLVIFYVICIERVFVINCSLNDKVGIVKKEIAEEIGTETSKLLFLSRRTWYFFDSNSLFFGAYKSHDDNDIAVKDEWDLSSLESRWKEGVILHVVKKDQPFEVTVMAFEIEQESFTFKINVSASETVKDLKKKITNRYSGKLLKWRLSCLCNVCDCNVLYNDEMILADIFLWGKARIFLDDAADEIKIRLRFVNFSSDELSSLQLDQNNSTRLRLLPWDEIGHIYKYVSFYTGIDIKRIKVSRNGVALDYGNELQDYDNSSGYAIVCKI
jgi:hypothetical protein